MVVITIVLVTAAIVFVLDLAFESLNKHGVEKIKSAITQMEDTNTENTSNETSSEKTNEQNSQEATENNSENTNQ